jgi:hypothetical protein
MGGDLGGQSGLAFPVNTIRLWLGCQDSNLGMPGSKPGALPLGDTPKHSNAPKKPVA